LTLETATFFCGVAAALRVVGLGDAFFLFDVTFWAFAAFFAGRSLEDLRVEALVALARLAFGREAFGFMTRFAAFAEARLPDGRVVDRRKPFVRLLLMCGISIAT
jgi:hypothetical protein